MVIFIEVNGLQAYTCQEFCLHIHWTLGGFVICHTVWLQNEPVRRFSVLSNRVEDDRRQKHHPTD